MAEQPNHGNRTKDIKLNLPNVFDGSWDKFQKFLQSAEAVNSRDNPGVFFLYPYASDPLPLTKDKGLEG